MVFIIKFPNVYEFVFDRVWLKAYPSFISGLKYDPELRERFYEYKGSGEFERWSDNAFKLYRTLDCIKKLLSKNYNPAEIKPDMCVNVRKYGVNEYFDFEYVMGFFIVNGFEFSRNQIESVRLLTYTYVNGGRPRYEKSIYAEYNPWLRIMVIPFAEGYRPHLIRFFYNPLIESKHKLGVSSEGYKFYHENFVPVEGRDSIVKVNHELMSGLSRFKDLAITEWDKWFGSKIDLVVKVTQVEYAIDLDISKLDLVNALRTLPGRSKTSKVDIASDKVNFATWSDTGLKYYVTVNKNTQVKVYSKFEYQDKIWNRLEFTVRVNTEVDNFNENDIIDSISEHYNLICLGLMKSNNLRKYIEGIAKCHEENCEKHYQFLLDLIVHGVVPGSNYYKNIAKVYKEHGYVTVIGRGRNSKYVITPVLANLSNTLQKAFKLVFKEIHLPNKLKEEPEEE